MRLALDPRARRLLRRLPRTTVYSALELLLLTLLAMQCARLVWTIVTPVGPVGEWKAPGALRPALPAPSPAALAGFDPFFRVNAQGSAPAVVTSLNLKLFGVREDRATGRGSAIIATADGQQRSFAVGEEIVAGVTLTGVGFDNVTLSRGGTTEQLYLDQSSPATSVGQPPPPSGSAPPLFTPPTPPPVTTTTPPPPMPVVNARPEAGSVGNAQMQPQQERR
jgi:general secretion pathway protein C